MGVTLTTILVRGCGDCPMLAPDCVCRGVDRTVDDLTTAPKWCPAATGLIIRLKPMPEGYHTWKGKDTCEVCGLQKRCMKVRGISIVEYLVDGEWIKRRPECKS